MKKDSSAILNCILSIMVFVAMCHGSAWAEEKDKLNYVRLSSGFYQPAGDLDDAGYDPGIDIGVLSGRYFWKT